MMSKFTLRIWPSVICLSAMILTACADKAKSVSLEKERDKILELHKAQRGFHFNKDSIAFANQLSKNFISVNRGVIHSPSKTETLSRYHGYFSAVEFVKWDDVSNPVIRFSDDGSLAYTIVDKVVVIRYKDEEGNPMEGKTHFAWTTIYKKYGDHWKIDVVTSTNKPEEDRKIEN